MPTLKVNRAEAKDQLEKQFTRGVHLSRLPVQDIDHTIVMRDSADNWRDYILALCQTLIVEPEVYEKLFEGSGLWVFRQEAELIFYKEQYDRDWQRDLSRLRNLISKLDLYSEPEKKLASQSKDKNSEEAIINRKVFVVHGHHEGAREATARFLEKLQFVAIILDEQPGRGFTLIEKFEKHSDVGYAVVLLTPDDEGRSKRGAELADRARQNVLFELGYFVAKLSRGRVCTLNMGVDIPSDLSGVEYITYDSHGGWKMKLAKELEAAGYVVDYSLLR